MSIVKRLMITPGEPAGIGPDLVVQLAQSHWPVELVVCADPALLLQRAQQLCLPLQLIPFNEYHAAVPQRAGTLSLLPSMLFSMAQPGILEKKNSHYVVNTLEKACDGCLSGQFAALITGPVHKGIINDAGVAFSGHTEFFAQRCGDVPVVMMLATSLLRVALVTNHLPLSQVSAAITQDKLREVLQTLARELQHRFAIKSPRIVVCGLNPHAGEGGHLGNEEILIINPVLDELRQQGLHLVGPVPADTLFQQKFLQDVDVVLTMYHDQGLPVLKSQGFGEAVNITLGLPFIRTSVDHGTALELAGTGKASTSSFIHAIKLAIKMADCHAR